MTFPNNLQFPIRLSPSGPPVPMSLWQQLLAFFGLLPGGFCAVANLAGLAALDATNFTPGAKCYVRTLKQYFELTATTAVAVDGITVVAALNLPGTVWIRCAPSSVNNPWLSQPAWYINAATGDDENFGGTSPAALKTWAEFIRRVGQNLDLHLTGTEQIEVFIETDLPNDDLRLVGLALEGGANNRVAVIGVPTVVRTGEVSVYVDGTINVEGTLTDVVTPVADWTADIGKVIRFTSGLAAGYFTFISNTAVAGVGTARLGKPTGPQAGGPAGFGYGPVPSPGDTYEILTLPKVRSYDLSATHGPVAAGGGIGISTLVIQFLRFGNTGGQSVNMAQGAISPGESPGVCFVGCQPGGNTRAAVGLGAWFQACYDCGVFHGGAWIFGAQAGGPVTFYGAQIVDMALGGDCYFETNVVFSGASQSQIPLVFGVWDGSQALGSAAISVLEGSNIGLSLNWGNTSSPYALNCQAYVRYTNQPTLLGTTEDVLLGVNALAWAAIPSKNCLPNQAQWTGAAAAQGADDNDYHVIVN